MRAASWLRFFGVGRRSSACSQGQAGGGAQQRRPRRRARPPRWFSLPQLTRVRGGWWYRGVPSRLCFSSRHSAPARAQRARCERPPLCLPATNGARVCIRRLAWHSRACGVRTARALLCRVRDCSAALLLRLVLVVASLRRIPVRGARWCQPPQPASSARRRSTRSARCQRAAHLHVESARRPFPAGLVGLWVCGSVGGCGLELPPVALFPLYLTFISVYLSLS